MTAERRIALASRARAAGRSSTRARYHEISEACSDISWHGERTAGRRTPEAAEREHLRGSGFAEDRLAVGHWVEAAARSWRSDRKRRGTTAKTPGSSNAPCRSARVKPYQSSTQSHTFPCMSNSPCRFAAFVPISWVSLAAFPHRHAYGFAATGARRGRQQRRLLRPFHHRHRPRPPLGRREGDGDPARPHDVRRPRRGEDRQHHHLPRPFRRARDREGPRLLDRAGRHPRQAARDVELRGAPRRGRLAPGARGGGRRGRFPIK